MRRDSAPPSADGSDFELLIQTGGGSLPFSRAAEVERCFLIVLGCIQAYTRGDSGRFRFDFKVWLSVLRLAYSNAGTLGGAPWPADAGEGLVMRRPRRAGAHLRTAAVRFPLQSVPKISAFTVPAISLRIERQHWAAEIGALSSGSTVGHFD